MAKKKPAAKKTRNRAAQDATLINVRALKRRVSLLEHRIAVLTEAMNTLRERVARTT